MEIKEDLKHKLIHKGIIAGAVLLLILIIIGLVFSIQPFLHRGSSSNSNSQNSQANSNPNIQVPPPPSGEQAGISHPDCTDPNCVFVEDNNKQLTISQGSTMTIDLPGNLYAQSNLIISSNPEDLFTKVTGGTVREKGDWVQELRADKPGTASVIVKSSLSSVSDFAVSVVVQ